MSAAIVFDLDGVLADTEPLKARAHRAAVEARGGRLPPALYRSQMGNPHDQVVRAFLEASGLEATPAAVEAYEERFRATYRRLLSEELRATDGAVELLAACRRQGRRLALVPSSDRWMVEIVLPRLGFEDAFAAVVAAEDVEREKPAPDPYLRAREALGPAPDGAAAVEDTASGAASAHAAGLPVVAVRHAFNREHDFGSAAAVVASLAPADGFLDVVDRAAGGADPSADGG